MSDDENGDQVRLDFSRFHPTDHLPWDKRCAELPGGWRTHLLYLWRYRWKEAVEWCALWPAYLVLCRLETHRTRTWHNGTTGFTVLCEYCGYRREARKDEEYPLPGRRQPSE
jgi:hypothetical protein